MILVSSVWSLRNGIRPLLGSARLAPTVRNFKAIIEKHDDGYVAYPVGLKGVVVAQGDTYEEALEDLRSAVAFHIETFGPEVIEDEDLAHEVFIAETAIAV